MGRRQLNRKNSEENRHAQGGQLSAEGVGTGEMFGAMGKVFAFSSLNFSTSFTPLHCMYNRVGG